MGVQSVLILSNNGQLMAKVDRNESKVSESELMLSFPLDLRLGFDSNRITVKFGQRGSIKVGHQLLAINRVPVNGRFLEDGSDALEWLEKPENFPALLRFGRPTLTTNEALTMASLFHGIDAFAASLSPELHSSGINAIETDTFTMHCCTALTAKLIVLSDPGQKGIDGILNQIYQVYADYLLKDLEYSPKMQVGTKLLRTKLAELIEKTNRFSILNVWM